MTSAGVRLRVRAGSSTSTPRWIADVRRRRTSTPPRPASSGGFGDLAEPEDLPRRSARASSSPPRRHRQLDMVDADDLDHGFDLGFGVVGFDVSASGFAGFGSSAFVAVVRPPSASGSAGAPAIRRSPPSTPRCPGRPTGRSRIRAAPGRAASASGTWMRLTRTRYQTRRPAAHAVDQDVGRLEVLDDVRVARLPALEALQRLLLELGAGDLDDRDRRLAPAGRRRLRADPLGRQARVRVAGGDGGRTFGGDLRRRAARLAATRARTRTGGRRARDGWTRGGSPACLA